MSDDATTTLACGRTIHELSDYLATDRTPPNVVIDTCPNCLNALDALSRVADLSRDLLEHEAETLPAPPHSWFADILSTIAREARTGRDLPLHHENPHVTMTITEGAVAELVRSVGDSIDGVMVGGLQLTGDAETPHAPVEVTATASIAWGKPAPELADTLRDRISEALRRHTELNVTAVNVVINDVFGYGKESEATS